MKRVIRGVARRLSKLGVGLRLGVMRIAVQSDLGSAVYFLVFSRSFRAEQRALLHGLLMHHDGAGSGAADYFLRRNIHRLEKGLCMRPRRDVFALDYIADTVEAYQVAVAGSASDADTTAWAFAVLSEYFDSVKPHPIIDPLREQFLSVAVPGDRSEQSRGPHRVDAGKVPTQRDFEAVHGLARQRKSVRWFVQKALPRELIDRAVEVASYAPSACNRQPYVFHIVDDPELVREVAGIPMGTAGYHENIPALAVVVGQLRAFANERDKHVIYIDASLAAMSFMYALEAQGVTSCPINWPDIAEKQEVMQTVMHLSSDERVIMLIAIGFADPEGMVCYSQKKSVQKLRRYNVE